MSTIRSEIDTSSLVPVLQMAQNRSSLTLNVLKTYLEFQNKVHNT